MAASMAVAQRADPPVQRNRLGAPRPGPTSQTASPEPLIGKVGTIYIVSTNNNTICTLVDMKGNPVTWASAGTEGYKNARKATTTAAQATAEKIAARSAEKGYNVVRIVMRGMGPGKHSAVTTLAKSGLKVVEIHEATSMPHNGCRAPKKRRG